jgi:hypothetical protein
MVMSSLQNLPVNKLYWSLANHSLGDGFGVELGSPVRVPSLMERWDDELWPRVKTIQQRIQTMNVTNAVATHIPVLLDEVEALIKELATIYGTIERASACAIQEFEAFVIEHLEGSIESRRAMLVGLPSEHRKAAAGLSDLAAAARVAGLESLLFQTPAALVPEALKATPMGAFYAAAIRDYVREYGVRRESLELTSPTWQEAPELAVAAIQGCLRTGEDARAEYTTALRSAVVALSASRLQLASEAKAIRDQFEELVTAARDASFLREESQWLIEVRSMALLRQLFLKMGSRLVSSGLLAREDDIFWLTLTEAKAYLSGRGGERDFCDIRILVLEREAELDAAARVSRHVVAA